jgi:signal transduction histidine kinase
VLDVAGRTVPDDLSPIAQAAASGKRTVSTLQIGPPGGDRRVFTIEAVPVPDESGRAAAVVAVFRDLTDRRESERRIAELAADLRGRAELVDALLARLPAAVALVHGPDLKVRAANARFLDLAGTGETTPAGRRVADLFPPRVVEQIAAWVARARDSGEPVRGEDVKVEGARYDAYWTYSVAPLRDGAAGREAVLLAILDTSEHVANRVEAQRSAARVEQKGAELDAVLQSLADGVVLIDDNGRVVAMNRAAEQVIGRTPEKGPPAPRLEDFPRLKHLHDPSGRVLPAEEWPAIRALAGETTDRREVYLVTEAQEKRYLSLSATPLRSRRGRLLGAAATFRDITREKEVESFKLQFIARAAHELRTPLTTIKGNLLLSLKGRFGALTPAQHDALATATRSVDAMVSLIDDLLDITRIESGRLRLFGEEVSLASLIERALPATTTLAAAKGITVGVHPSVAEVVGYWDAEKVGQVFANVLSNAVKFTRPGGRVDIRAYREAHVVTVAVRDTGIGIPRDKLALVFQPFVSVNRSDSGVRQRGTGLGLSIAQSVVEAHGGRMWAESEGTGRGTAVYFTLPLDHRRAARARVNRPARVRAGGVALEPSVIADVSADGVSVVAPDQVLSARELTVEISIPPYATVTATGPIVRVEPVEGSSHFKAGVHFQGLPESDRAAIGEWVRQERGRAANGAS